MADEIHVEPIHVSFGHARLERRLRGDRVRARRDQAEPLRHAVDVRVDGEVGAIERKEQDARCGLRTDAGQGEERVPELLIGSRLRRSAYARSRFVSLVC